MEPVYAVVRSFGAVQLGSCKRVRWRMTPELYRSPPARSAHLRPAVENSHMGTSIAAPVSKTLNNPACWLRSLRRLESDRDNRLQHFPQ